MEKRWIFKERADNQSIQQLSKQININAYLAELLLQRGIHSFDEAKTFFRPKLDQLHDPFIMKDMDKAVNRLTEAVSKQEHIVIYGDYDVDGTTSVALCYGFLKSFFKKIDFYIPDRNKEGYGISEQGVRWAKEQGASTMIALDCGIKAMNQAQLAKDLGIDLIICDHHLPGDELPPAYAILDPKRKDCDYPYKELSGCGVGFKLLQGFCLQNTIDEHRLFNFLDLLVVSIASDIVPITGENRVLAHFGMKKLNAAPSCGLKALIEKCGFKSDLNISNVVFGIGPRINAAGRIGHAHEAVKLLIAEDKEAADEFASQIDVKNSERKDLDKDITSEALERIAKSDTKVKKHSTVLYDEGWHKGVIGIVASRCIETYYRPTIILTKSNAKATGSARSVEGFDIYEAISECSDLLSQYGGHTHAAGLTMEVEKIDDFVNRFEEVVSNRIRPEQLVPLVKLDLEVPLTELNFKFLSIQSQMAPFGPGNLEPLLASKNVKLKYPPRVLKEEHLKVVVTDQDEKTSFEAIGFGLGHWAEQLESVPHFEIAYHLNENNYMGNKTLQLYLQDIRIPNE